MVHDVLEALNKSGFTEYNKDIEKLVEQIIKSNSDKKKKNSKKIEIDDNDNKELKEDVIINTKEKID